MVSWVLKEWRGAIAALLAGKTILLLRKGGIREAQGQFSLAARQVLLLPTLEHQNTALLKPEFRGLVNSSSVDAVAMDPPVAQDNPPAEDSSVRFEGWATITHALRLGSEAEVWALLPHLVWNEQFLRDRLTWQPDRPLFALLLRGYRLPQPLLLPRHRGYGGCRSWVELAEPVAVSAALPALAEAEYQGQVAAILERVPTATPLE